MSESSRKALVVPIKLEKHENADNLSIIKIDGFQVVGNTAAWTGVESGVYVEPETWVDVTRPEFSFLRRPDKNRDKEVVLARKLRGEWSIGLLVPTPEGFSIGDDCWDYLGLEHYEPEPDFEGLKAGDCSSAPPNWSSLSKYDIENYRKYSILFQDEMVCAFEKLNGQNMSCVYSDGAYHVKSRNLWKKENEFSDFWKALNSNEPLKKYLRDNPDKLVQGELIGKVKGYLYGTKGVPEFRAFDIRLLDRHYLPPEELVEVCDKNEIKMPKYTSSSLLFKHDKDYIEYMSSGKTLENDTHIREGIVIRPQVPRFETKLDGRLVLKLVSNAYLEKKGK